MAALNALGLQIHELKAKYTSLSLVLKQYKCYSTCCVTEKSFSCYSPLCLKRLKLRAHLLQLLHKANDLSQGSKIICFNPAVGSILSKFLTQMRPCFRRNAKLDLHSENGFEVWNLREKKKYIQDHHVCRQNICILPQCIQCSLLSTVWLGTILTANTGNYRIL